MDYQKPTQGQPMKPPSAATWSAMLDAGADSKIIGAPGRPRQAAPANSTIILVRNTSAAAVDRFNAMALRQPTILPADNQNEFERRIVMDVDTPKATDMSNWCVLLDAIDKQQIGRAVIAGLAIAKINLVTKNDTNVEIADTKTILQSGGIGAGELLWVDGGVGTAKATGEQDAIVRIGARSSGWIRIGSAKAASGIYGAKRCILKPTWKWNTGSAAVVTPDAVFDVSPTENCLYFNQPELFNNPVTHWVPVGDNGAYLYARASQEPNDLGLPTFTDNYAKSIRLIRLNSDETWVQVSYMNNPTDTDWVNAIQVGECDEGA